MCGGSPDAARKALFGRQKILDEVLNRLDTEGS
jgi:hypothetical protein